jgi:hypothetical protein
VTLLDQPSLDIAEARRRLGALRARGRHRALLGAALLVLGALLCALGTVAVGIPLLVGATAAALFFALGRDNRTRLLVRLVAQDDAWAIDEVRAAADRLVSVPERRRLAEGLTRAAELATPNRSPASQVDPHRAAAAGPRLLDLAATLGDPAAPVRPPAVALCRRLLSDAVLSPLYNPNLADADLDRVLDRIESAV